MKSPKLQLDDACLASMLTLLCAYLCRLRCFAHAGDFLCVVLQFLYEKRMAENLVGHVLSVKLQEGCYSLAYVNMWFPLGWHGNLILWRLVSPPIHTTRVVVVSSIAIIAVKVATEATCKDNLICQLAESRKRNVNTVETLVKTNTILMFAGSFWKKKFRTVVLLRSQYKIYFLLKLNKHGFFTSTKATIPSSIAPSTVAAEASRTAWCLTVVSGSKATWEPEKTRERDRHYNSDNPLEQTSPCGYCATPAN